MRSENEIFEMLVHELYEHLDEFKAIHHTPIYYNEILGDASFLLAGLLELLLKRNYIEWDKERWIDDSIITNVILENNLILLEGIMIWGKMGVTNQWTDPFLFEMEIPTDEKSSGEFAFLFCDVNNPEIAYEDFRDHPEYWRRKPDRAWRYLINSNKSLI